MLDISFYKNLPHPPSYLVSLTSNLSFNVKPHPLILPHFSNLFFSFNTDSGIGQQGKQIFSGQQGLSFQKAAEESFLIFYLPEFHLLIIVFTHEMKQMVIGIIISAKLVNQSIFSCLNSAYRTNIIKYGYGYCGYLAIAIVVVPFLTVGVYKNRKA